MNRPLCNLFPVCVLSSWACPDHGTARTHDSPPPSLQPPERLVNEWRFAKNFSTLPFIKPNDERKWNFQSVYSSLCFRTSYILYKLQCNIACGGHAVFSIGHISLFTEVKCWLLVVYILYELFPRGSFRGSIFHQELHKFVTVAPWVRLCHRHSATYNDDGDQPQALGWTRAKLVVMEDGSHDGRW